jgi:hypothetical protein
MSLDPELAGADGKPGAVAAVLHPLTGAAAEFVPAAQDSVPAAQDSSERDS